MKKVVLTIATVVLTLGAYAQTDKTDKSRNQSENSYSSKSQNHDHPDGYHFKDGKVVLVRNGKKTPVDQDVTLTNGTRISSDGHYTERGGTKTKFKDGEHIDLSGKRTSKSDSMHDQGQDGRNQSQSDGYVFQNGKMQHLKDGKSTPVDKDVTLDNGTIITSKGDYTKRDGSKTRFKEGDHMDMSGKRTSGSATQGQRTDGSNTQGIGTGGSSTQGQGAAGSSTQGQGTNSSSTQGQSTRNQNQSDGYLFQNGRMVKIENGKSTPVDKDVTLDNGTIITSKGDYTKRGGSKTRFKEGDHMDKTGKIVAGKDARKSSGDDKSNKNMYLLNDDNKNDNNRK